MSNTELTSLTDRLAAVRESLSQRNIMTYSGTTPPDAKTRALVEVIDVLDAVIEHLKQDT